MHDYRIRVPKADDFQLGTNEYLGPGQSRNEIYAAQHDLILNNSSGPDDAYSDKQ